MRSELGLEINEERTDSEEDENSPRHPLSIRGTWEFPPFSKERRDGCIPVGFSGTNRLILRPKKVNAP